MRILTIERTFAHVCDTGGACRSWLRGLKEVGNRNLIAVAGHNLGRILWKHFGIGKPRSLQGLRALMPLLQTLIHRSTAALSRCEITWQLRPWFTCRLLQIRPPA